MIDYSLTLSALTVANNVQTYTDTTIEGSIQPQGSTIKELPLGNRAEYAYTLFTADAVHEGDRVEDANGDNYIILHTTAYWDGDKFSHYQCELLQLKSVTLRSRAFNGTYAETVIYMNIAVSGQSQIQPKTHYGINDYSGLTASTVYEGDQITDDADHVYTVMNVTFYPSVRSDGFMWKAAALTPRFEAVTLGVLTLGAADATTGIYAPSYATSTIYMGISAKGQNITKLTAGYYNKYDYVGVSDSAVLEGDQVTDSQGIMYEVMQVHTYPSTRTDYVLNWRVCALTKRDFATQPTISGIWHLDSSSITTDPRHRQRVLIAAYYTAGNVTKDDGTTAASVVTCFDGATYPITRIFLTKAIDAVAVITRNDKATSTIYTDKLLGRKPCGTIEQVQIDIYAVNKSTITATNLAEKLEAEIKRIYTVYDPISTVRDIENIKPDAIDLGYGYLYQTSILIEYKRPLDSYVAALPTITYGDSQATTYIFPNATDIKFSDPDTGDVRMLPPGRLGDYLQILGMSDFIVTITADIDLDASNVRWKRAGSGSQVTLPAADVVAWQVFSEIKFGGKTSANQVFQNLNWGGGTTIPVRLVDFNVDGSVLTVTFQRYSSASGSAGTVKAWYGMT